MDFYEDYRSILVKFTDVLEQFENVVYEYIDIDSDTPTLKMKTKDGDSEIDLLTVSAEDDEIIKFRFRDGGSTTLAYTMSGWVSPHGTIVDFSYETAKTLIKRARQFQSEAESYH